MCFYSQISQPKHGQIGYIEGLLKLSEPANFKVPGFENWPTIVGVIEQNKIQQTYFHHCTYSIKTDN